MIISHDVESILDIKKREQQFHIKYEVSSQMHMIKLRVESEKMDPSNMAFLVKVKLCSRV